MGRRAILRPGDLPLYLPAQGMPDLTTNNLNIKRPNWEDPDDVQRWIRDMNAVLDRCETVFDDVLAGRRSWRL